MGTRPDHPRRSTTAHRRGLEISDPARARRSPPAPHRRSVLLQHLVVGLVGAQLQSRHEKLNDFGILSRLRMTPRQVPESVPGQEHFTAEIRLPWETPRSPLWGGLLHIQTRGNLKCVGQVWYSHRLERAGSAVRQALRRASEDRDGFPEELDETEIVPHFLITAPIRWGPDDAGLLGTRSCRTARSKSGSGRPTMTPTAPGSKRSGKRVQQVDWDDVRVHEVPATEIKRPAFTMPVAAPAPPPKEGRARVHRAGSDSTRPARPRPVAESWRRIEAWMSSALPRGYCRPPCRGRPRRRLPSSRRRSARNFRGREGVVPDP